MNTNRRLSASAYRILGLPATATQADIDQAARKMRIWPDPARIPPTPWDLPSLGPVPRSKQEIEQAVTRLADPATRLAERLFWFATGQSPLSAKSATAISEAVQHLSQDPHPAAPHDAALAAFTGSLLADPEISDAESWKYALLALAKIAKSDDYLMWLLEVENAGQFEKQASAEETGQAMSTLPAAAVEVLSSKADELLTAGRLYDCSQLVEVMRACSKVSPEAKRVASRILDHMEDTLEARCQELTETLRAKVKEDDANFEANRASNHRACQDAETYFDEMVDPVLAELQSVSRADRHLRIRMAAAGTTEMIAIGWIWSGQVSRAQKSFAKALTLARGTPYEKEIEAKYQRLTNRQRDHVQKNLARAQEIRQRQQVQMARSSNSGWTSGGGGGLRWVWALVVGGGVLLRACAAIVSTTSPRHSTAPPPSTYTRTVAPAPASDTTANPTAPAPTVAEVEPAPKPRHTLVAPPQGTARDGNQQALLNELTSGKKH